MSAAREWSGGTARGREPSALDQPVEAEEHERADDGRAEAPQVEAGAAGREAERVAR